MIPVIADLIEDINNKEQSTGDTQSESQYIQNTISEVLTDMTYSSFKKILYHVLNIKLKRFKSRLLFMYIRYYI